MKIINAVFAILLALSSVAYATTVDPSRFTQGRNPVVSPPTFTITGTPGTAQAIYYIVCHDSFGNISNPSASTIINTVPNSLSSGNRVNLTWINSCVSVDVLKNSIYTALAIGVTTGNTVDVGQGLIPYQPYYPPLNGAITLLGPTKLVGMVNTPSVSKTLLGIDFIDLSIGPLQQATLTTNSSIALINVVDGQHLTLDIVQDSSGNHTPTFTVSPGYTLSWNSGVTPTVTATANSYSVYSFHVVGTNVIGALIGSGSGGASGVTSLAGGTGISVNQSTGAVTATNTGVTSLIAGTGMSVSQSTGAVTINNTSGLSTVSIVTGDPTGATASTAGIQAAFTAACNGTTNGAVYFPSGIWKTAQITGFTGPCTIYGNGDSSQIEPDTTYSWGNGVGMFVATQPSSGIRWSNLKFIDPNAITGGPIIAIVALQPTQYTIDNIKVVSTNNNFSFGMFLDGANHLRFSNNYIYNVQNTSYFVGTNTGTSNDIVWDSTNTADTTGLQSPGRTITGCVITGNTTLTCSAGANFVSGDVRRAVTCGSNVPTSPADFISAISSGTVATLNNNATNSGSQTCTLSQVPSTGGNGFFCANNTNNTNGCTNVRVGAVHAFNVYDTGIEIGSAGGTGVHTNVVIDGPVIANDIQGLSGILCRDCNNFVISNSTVAIHGGGSTGPGIGAWADVPMANGLISNNTIVQPNSNNSHGACIDLISTSSTNVTSAVSVNNNTCIPGPGADNAGILVNGYDTAAAFTGNKVTQTQPSATGMYFNCSQANCTQLNIENNNTQGGFYGIQLSNVLHSIAINNLMANNNGGQPALNASGTLTGTQMAPNQYVSVGSTYGGPIPTVTSCQSSPTQPVAPSNNQSGCASVGTGGTTCIVNFNPTLDNIPLNVQLTDLTSAVALRPSLISASVFTVNGLTASDKFCWSLPNASN